MKLTCVRHCDVLCTVTTSPVVEHWLARHAKTWQGLSLLVLAGCLVLGDNYQCTRGTTFVNILLRFCHANCTVRRVTELDHSFWVRRSSPLRESVMVGMFVFALETEGRTDFFFSFRHSIPVMTSAVKMTSVSFSLLCFRNRVVLFYSTAITVVSWPTTEYEECLLRPDVWVAQYQQVVIAIPVSIRI